MDMCFSMFSDFSPASGRGVCVVSEVSSDAFQMLLLHCVKIMQGRSFNSCY